MKKIALPIIVLLLLSGCATSNETEVTTNTPNNTENTASGTEEVHDETAHIETEKISKNRIYEEYDNIELIAKLEGHSQKIWTLDTCENNTFVSGGQDGKIILWDSKTLESLITDNSHTRLVEEIMLLDDGDVISISDDNSVRQIDSITGVSEELYKGTTKEFTVSKDEKLIAISDNNNVTVYELDGFAEVSKIKTDDCFDVRFNSDASLIFSVGHNGKVQRFDVKSGELLCEYEGISFDVHCLEITEDDKYIVAGSTDQKVCVWDVESGNRISSYFHGDGLYDVAVSKDGKIITSVGVDRKVYIAELETGKVLKRLPHADEIHTVAIDPNGQYIVAGGYDNVVYVWGFNTLDVGNLQVIDKDNAADVKLIGKLNYHEGWVFDADISHDNTKIASAERGEIIKVNICDVKSKSVIQSFEMEQAPVEIRFSSNDRYLLCKGEMGDLCIWDILEREVIYSSKENDEEVISVDISSDDKYLVTGGRHGEVKLWDFETMEILKQAKFDDEFITQTVFSPDDSMIAFAYAGSTEDFSAHVLSTDDLSEIYVTDGHREYNYTLDYSVKTNMLASCSGDCLIKLWNAETGDLIITLEGHSGKVMDVDFLLSEDVVVSGSAHDRTIRLWDIKTGEQLKKIFPGGEVQTVEMADNGKFFISAGQDGSISIWGVEE